MSWERDVRKPHVRSWARPRVLWWLFPSVPQRCAWLQGADLVLMLHSVLLSAVSLHPACSTQCCSVLPVFTLLDVNVLKCMKLGSH